MDLLPVDLYNLNQGKDKKVSDLNGRNNNSSKPDFKKVAKEMESLFAYQLLKKMREANETISGEEKGNDYNTYMDMFDIEVSRVLSERGLGLQDSIISWLERMPGDKNSEIKAENKKD